MKVAINKCYGGFGLSMEGWLYYAKLKGITLYPVTDKRGNDGSLNFNKFEYVKEGDRPFLVHYLTKPLLDDGSYAKDSYFSTDDIERTDPFLIQTIEELGAKADGSCAELEIVEIPNDISWHIEEYDGIEWIAEDHRTWE